jgi:hypothetical protein
MNVVTPSLVPQALCPMALSTIEEESCPPNTF